LKKGDEKTESKQEVVKQKKIDKWGKKEIKNEIIL
jgi:hypothetical protein